MLTKIDNTVKFGKKHGGFGIEILFPGTSFPHDNDTGIATIVRIDHAQVMPGTLIPMHPHRDDEILTYLRSGQVKHRDSEGMTEIFSSQKLMLMNAGAQFSHEELTLEEGGILNGLQVFIRPQRSGLEPQVQFHEFSETVSINHWRPVAGKGSTFPLHFRSDTWIYDIRMNKGATQHLPELPNSLTSLLFYVFQGEIRVSNGMPLKTGESLFIEGEQPGFTALTESDIVLFATDKNSPYSAEGMYSGNQKQKAS